MKNIIKYYWGCFLFAVHHSFGKADMFAGGMGFIFPPIARYINMREIALSNAQWQLPLCLFILLFCSRLIYAPYSMHKELMDKIVNSKGLLRFDFLAPHVTRIVDATGAVLKRMVRIEVKISNLSDNLVIYTMQKMVVRIPGVQDDIVEGPFESRYAYPKSQIVLWSRLFETTWNPTTHPRLEVLYGITYDTDPP